MSTTSLFASPSRLPVASRARLVEALNARLADGMDLYTQIKVAHWNIKGPHFAHLPLILNPDRTKMSKRKSQTAVAGEWVTLYPPVPTPIQRVANVERAQLMIESSNRLALLRFLQQAQAIWLDEAQKNRRSGLIRWAVDVDPLSI